MEKAVNQFIQRLLTPLGHGWKSIVGLAAMLLLAILAQTDVISAENFETWYKWAQIVFGVGIIHRVSR